MFHKSCIKVASGGKEHLLKKIVKKQLLCAVSTKLKRLTSGFDKLILLLPQKLKFPQL